MLKKLVPFCLLAAPLTLAADEAADNEALLQAMLDDGYLQIARGFHDAKGSQGLTEFAKKLVDLRFIEAEVKAGNSAKSKEATKLRRELVGSINKDNLDAARMFVKFDYGVELLEAGEIDEGIDHLEFFTRYYLAVSRKTESVAAKQKLGLMFYDVDLHLGKAYFSKAQGTDDKDKQIDFAIDGFDKVGNYIWSLQNKDMDFAIKGYPLMLDLVAFLDHPDRNEAEEPLDEVIDQILSTKDWEGEGWSPIWRATGNPESLPAIFETARKCLELDEKNRKKLASSLLKSLEKDIKLDPEPTYYMRHQLNLELAKFCAYLAFDSGIGNESTYKKKGVDFINKVPNDPTKSPYAGPSAPVAARLGVDRGEVTLGDPLLKVCLDHLRAKRYTQARRGFENLVRETPAGSQRRASMWFYIGWCYYESEQFLEASLAFEKAWETRNDWTEGDMSGTKAFDLHENAAKRFSQAQRENYPKRAKELQIADRAFQQEVRERVFTHRGDSEQGNAALFFWASNMKAADYIENHQQEAYDAFAKIPETSKYYTEALYNMFQCSFGIYQDLEKEDPNREKRFNQATQNAEAFFARTEKLDKKDPKNKSLLNADAAARSTVVQLYLLEPSKAQDARDILETLESQYGSYLSETEKKRIPSWKIEARINLGTDKALEEAYLIWDTWQKEFLRSNPEDPNPVLNKSTKSLLNDGIKEWMRKNPQHARFATFQKFNSTLGKWILTNIKITPLLLVQQAVTEKQNKQWRGVAENTDLFVQKFEAEPSWKTDKVAKKYGPQMYVWQVEAHKKINTEESWLKVAECYAAYNERGAHSMHRRRMADAYKTAGDRAFAKGNTTTGKDHYLKAAGMYNQLRRGKGSHAEYTENWWSSYEMTYQCREALGEYGKLVPSLISMRLSVTNSDKKRQWLLDWIDRVQPKLGPNDAAKLQQLRDNVIKDHEDMLAEAENQPEPEDNPENGS